MIVVRSLAAACVLALGLACVTVAPATAEVSAAADRRAVLTITHAPVTPTSVTGTGLGTVRTYYVPTTVSGRKPRTGYMAGTLTTIAVGLPGGREARAADLVFVVGSERNQLVVGGLSLYASDGATLSAGQSTIRPIIGGSGAFSGARGSVESTNLGDRGWRHVFRFTPEGGIRS